MPGAAPHESPETELQVVLRTAISSLVRVDRLFDFGADTQYGLMNYIARYALAANEYWVSSGAVEIVAARGVPFQRRWLDKRLGTFEHLVPASVVRNHLRGSDRSDDAIYAILR